MSVFVYNENMKIPCLLKCYLSSIFVIISLITFPVQATDTVSADKNTPISVQLNWHHQFQFAGFYAALKQGYYERAGLDVTIKSWQPGIDVVDEVVSGRANFATAYSSVIADYAKGAPIKLVMASFQFSPMVLLSHTPLNDLEQMSGKSVMHYGNLQIKGLIDKVNAIASEQVVEVNSSGNLNDFIEHKVDYYAAYKTNEPYRLSEMKVPYYIIDPKTFGIQSYGDLVLTSKKTAQLEPEKVSAFRNATIRGWEYAIRHQVEIVDYIVDNYPVKKQWPALLEEAAATSLYVKSGKVPVGHVEEGKLMATAVQAKESGLITQAQFDSLDMNGFLFKVSRILLTPEEQAYLKAHPVIKIGNDLNWEPFEFVNEQGQWSGMAAEYFKLFESQLDVKFEFNTNKSWSEVVRLAQKGEIDVFSNAVATKERQQYMNFTEPYMTFPMVLATREDVAFIEDVSKLKQRKVAVVDGYWSHESFKTRYPNIELLLVDSVEEGLQAVLSGQAYAYSGNLATINFGIKKYGLNGLHIAGHLGEDFELAIGVQKDNPILLDILTKALATVTQEQRNQIYNHWLQLEVVNKVDRRVWINTILIVSAIILALITLVAFLNVQKKRQKTYIDQINELSLATYTNIETRKMEWVSDSFVKLCGYSKEELTQQVQDKLRHPDVDASYYEAIWNQLKAGQVWQGELRAKAKNGQDYWVKMANHPDIVNGKVKGFWTTRTDISDKKNLEEISIRDELTGVFNRHYFNEMFEKELHRASRKHESFAIATFDIDYFKQINDFYGHQKGDEVLKQVVNAVLKHTQRAGDFMFRVGGEEFMVFSDLQDQKAFFNYLELLRESVEALAIMNPKAELKTLSISVGGVFCERAENITTTKLYGLVDKALYEAKHQGRNQIVMHVV